MTQNQKLLGWVADMQKICKPDAVVWINGSKEQLDALRAEACATGEIAPLNQEKLPGCYIHRTALNDVARVEHRTFICTRTEERRRPHQQLDGSQRSLCDDVRELFDGSMKGRTMYVIPYSMGPIGSPFSKIGIELTDSIYVVLNMAHHDPNRRGCARGAGRQRRFCQGPALQGAI